MRFRDLFTEEQSQCTTKGRLSIAQHGLWSASLHRGEIIDLRWNWKENNDNIPVKVDDSLPLLVQDHQLFLAWFRKRGEGIGKHSKTAGLYVDGMNPILDWEMPTDLFEECKDPYSVYVEEVVPHLLDHGCIFVEGELTRNKSYRYLL